MSSINAIRDNTPTFQDLGQELFNYSLYTIAGYAYGGGQYRLQDIFAQQLVQGQIEKIISQITPLNYQSNVNNKYTLLARLSLFAISGELSELLLDQAGIKTPWYYPSLGLLPLFGVGLLYAGSVKAIAAAENFFTKNKPETTVKPLYEIPVVNAGNFDKEVLEAKGKVMVFVHDGKKIVSHEETFMEGFLQVDGSNDKALAKKYSLKSLPALLTFENGELIGTEYGANNE